MKLLIGTPCFAGLMYLPYVNSLIDTFHWAAKNDVKVSLWAIGNESLIHRGRNGCINLALREGYDKLIFIDADIGWTPAELERLLGSEQKIVGGAYPQKTIPLKMNLNQLPNPKTSERGEFEVKHLATGFLMFDLKYVREKICPLAELYMAQDNAGEWWKLWDLFPTRVEVDEFNPEMKLLQSEDWGFCNLVRRAGGSIWFDPRVLVTHTGTYTFDLRNPPHTHQEYEKNPPPGR